jgi:hypothetical protein
MEYLISKNIIEKCFYTLTEKETLFTWFINQDHIPFDMSSDAQGMYYQLYQEFLQELYKLSLSAKGSYFWFNEGKLVNCGGSDIISINSIYMDKVLLRDFKIDIILS